MTDDQMDQQPDSQEDDVKGNTDSENNQGDDNNA